MKFLFYSFLVCAMAAVPAVLIGQLISLVSDDTGLFVGLFVFVALVWEAFSQHKASK